jgi:aspartate ammonia-lyase
MQPRQTARGEVFMAKFRIERDSMGEMNVPEEAYYGIQTLRAVENFPVSGLRADPALIRAYATIKRAAAVVHGDLGLLEMRKTSAIVTAADEVIDGKHDAQFVVDVFQAGAGTSFNMNTNEVIANRALELLGDARGDYASLHPNDDVNRSQSTNDTFPTAMHLAALERLAVLIPVLENLADALEERGKAFHKYMKAGRTHLQDATPMRLGQEFRAYAQAIRRSVRICQAAGEELADLAIGGSAVGTGLNVPAGYREGILDQLRQTTGLELRLSDDLREAMQSRQAIGAMSAALRGLALELTRIANDLRLLSSGPATGFNEIMLPPVQPGSSIMPAKVNPVMAECLNMVAYQVIGNDTAVAMGVQAGQLELNVMMPMMAHNLLQSFQILNNFLPVFTERCIAGVKANPERMRKHALRTAALGTILNPVTGYAKAAELIKESLATGKDIRTLVLEQGILDEQGIDELLAPGKLTGEED